MLLVCFLIIIFNFFCALADGFPTSSTVKNIQTAYPNERLGSKLGEPNNPAATCRQIKFQRLNVDNDHYWINPTKSADVRDAVLVHCDIRNGRTCIYPRTTCSKVMDISSAKSDVWLGKADPEFKIVYKMTPQQLTALQELSAVAIQNITYHCQNSVAYYDNVSKTYDNSLKLTGWNGVEITPQSYPDQRFKPFTSELDGCKNRKKKWSATKISVLTEYPSRLPIVDIAVRDFGRPRQSIFVEIGPVCYY